MVVVLNPLRSGGASTSPSNNTSLEVTSARSSSVFNIDRRFSDTDLLERDSENNAHNSPLLTGFLLLNAMIGSGILNQPQVFMYSGIASGLIMFLIASIFTWLGIVVLVDAGVSVQKFDYSALALKAFGPIGEKVVDASIIIGNFGALLSYVDIIGITASDLFLSWGCSNINACGPYLITCLIMFFLVFPVCLKKNFGELAIYSVFSMTAILLILALVIIGGPQVENRGQIHAFNNKFSSQLGSIIFTLSCAFAVFPTYNSFNDGTPESWRRVSGMTVFIGFILCSIMGIAGYCAFKQNTNGLILNNFTGHYADFFKILLICHLILYIPVEYVIMRHSLIKLCGRSTGLIISFIPHAILTFMLLFLAVMIILLLHHAGLSQGDVFGLVIDFTGGFTGSITSFILPGLIYMKLMKQPSKLFYYPCALMVIFGIVIAIYVPINAVLLAIRDDD